MNVWTGRQMLIFGRALKKPPAPWSVNVAAAFNPGTNTWRRLRPPPGDTGNYEGRYSAVWTGKEMLVWGQGLKRGAFNPSTNRWRPLPNSPLLAVHEGHGLVVSTRRREMIGWGGGCCGDAFSDGVAYKPTTNRWRGLPAGRSPAPSGR